jgi:hypothetical protein
MVYGMDISAIIQAVLAPREDRAGRALIDMKPGDRLSGQVLKIAQDGRVLMDLGGNRALAQIGFPVQIGQRLTLRVVTAGSVLHLKAESGHSGDRCWEKMSHTNFLQAISGKDRKRFIDIVGRISAKGHGAAPLLSGIQESLVKIGTVFENVPMDDSAQQIGRWVKKVVEYRGVLFEKQLADAVMQTSENSGSGVEKKMADTPVRVVISENVKSHLIRIRNDLSQLAVNSSVADKQEAGDIRFLRRTVDQLLGHIEQQQDRIAASRRDGDIQQTIVHTLELPNPKKPLQLKVYYPRKGANKADNQQYRMALLLDLDALGPMRIDLAMMSRQLRVGFFVASAAVKQMMEGPIQKVETALIGRFDEVQVNVAVSQKKIKNFDKRDPVGTQRGRIDLNV